MDLMAITSAIQVAYRVLAEKWLTLASMMMTFSLYAWAMYLGSWIHFGIAAAFGVTIFLPVLWGGRGGSLRTTATDNRGQREDT